DTRVSWLPDGTGFLYTQEQVDRLDRDRCLVLMPATGGGIQRSICPESDVDGDSLDDFESPAVSSTGRMAYVRTTMLAFFGRSGPDNAQLVLGTFSDPYATTQLTTLPYFGPASRPVDIVSDLHWAGPNTLIFLTEQQTFPSRCGGCAAVDTV